jgi:hypothetical protein
MLTCFEYPLIIKVFILYPHLAFVIVPTSTPIPNAFPRIFVYAGIGFFGDTMSVVIRPSPYYGVEFTY